MLNQYEDYQDSEIPNFCWVEIGNDLEGSVSVNGQRLQISATNQNGLWKIVIRNSKGKKVFSICVSDLLKHEIMIITETHILDQMNA